MNKLIVMALFVLGLGFLAGKADASSYARAPKQASVIAYTTTVSSVCVGPGAVYQVTLSSGAASEFVALFDTGTINGITNANSIANGLKERILYSSTTANTDLKFDPPLFFSLGIFVGDSAATGQATILYECGRGIGE